jgi:hypothetical protein
MLWELGSEDWHLVLRLPSTRRGADQRPQGSNSLCSPKMRPLLDDLGGLQQDRLGNGQPEGPGGLQVDDDFEFRG